MWYTGTATFTTGSLEVVGDGNVDFVSNVFPGDACIGPNGLPMEIDRADSRNKLILRTPYNGQGGTGQFRVQPTQDYIRSLAYAAVDLKNTYGNYRDTVLQGIFQPGTNAAPGVRGLNDQDTGLRWLGDNRLALTAGGADRAVVGPDGLSVSGRMDLRSTIAVANPNNGADQTYIAQDFYSPSGSLVGRIASVQATGTFVDAGQLALCTARGGVATEQVRIMDTGNVGIGTTAPAARHHVKAAVGGEIARFETPAARGGGNGYVSFYDAGGRKSYLGYGSLSDDFNIYNECVGGAITFGTSVVERGRFDVGGNFLVGVASGSANVIAKGVAQGSAVMAVFSSTTGSQSAAFNAVAAHGYSSAGAAMNVGRNTDTNRSINSGGTVNASGADYAEYMVKADGCGLIAKGDVCGVDRDGKLTDRWSDAISFVVKSTDPSLVGGDTWATHLPPKPELPGAEPMPPVQPGPAPVAPIEPGPEPDEEGPVYAEWLQARFAFAVAERDYALALAEWQAATDAYPAAHATFEANHAAWADAKAAYARDLPAWEAQLEAARVRVDRIAFCGQVPCNVSGDFAVGDYIIPVQDGAAIKAVAVKDDDSLTDRQYRRRIGKVWAIRGGRAWIDVQHG
ncbi:hypothetical protein [Sphingomonas sanguinis]|jgi:hypothetical protein|uniref:Uncharacterized protein n=1 Tax=Sphingomonas sanguinis TaxID=33051 RepID=A0A7Y7QXE3_9SPHN|nr:hypothetical protein [Sphingomonas sanguinis]MBZ6383142.1 hypothetical protein [Sphingomonas sanguinis]NNG50004.1 hypothetical protein [Sphingomonas sanguinis]NNG53660.1 hypothetical protein [Sphingomonas sanguinis]NVP32438.1 hypothetical protein [Sphingomonas sanguinis]